MIPRLGETVIPQPQGEEFVRHSDRVLLVSADGHASADPETFRPYLESRFLDRLDDLKEENARYIRSSQKISRFTEEALEIIDTDRAIRSGGADGAFDVDRRLAEMDREGIAAELVLSGAQCATVPFFGPLNEEHPADLRAAGARAYHRWLADAIAQAKGRLIGVANCGPCVDMDDTIKELEWVAERGFRSVSVPGIITDPALPSLADPYFEPFWKACADLGLVLSVHAGHGHPQGKMLRFLERISQVGDADDGRDMIKAMQNDEGSPLDLDYIPARAMWTLMLAGVFDRYPTLQLALTEVRADWVPATLAVLNEYLASGETPLKKRPSEYWQSNCWAGASAIKQSEVRLRHEIGVDRMMFGRDYPHPESTWPNTWDWLRDALAGVPEDDVRAIVGENALRCYGLDASPLRLIADRIGPSLDDLLGRHDVDPRSSTTSTSEPAIGSPTRR